MTDTYEFAVISSDQFRPGINEFQFKDFTNKINDTGMKKNNLLDLFSPRTE